MSEDLEDKGYRIVVVDRGFVFVGFVREAHNCIHVLNARNIRKWGTTQGLAQLAKDGPTKETILDPEMDIEIPHRAVIFTIKTIMKLWPDQS